MVGGATFQYQIWPFDKSNTWQTFLANPITITRDYVSAKDRVAVEVVYLRMWDGCLTAEHHTTLWRKV